jgi:hypothetical protein
MDFPVRHFVGLRMHTHTKDTGCIATTQRFVDVQRYLLETATASPQSSSPPTLSTSSVTKIASCCADIQPPRSIVSFTKDIPLCQSNAPERSTIRWESPKHRRHKAFVEPDWPSLLDYSTDYLADRGALLGNGVAGLDRVNGHYHRPLHGPRHSTSDERRAPELCALLLPATIDRRIAPSQRVQQNWMQVRVWPLRAEPDR